MGGKRRAGIGAYLNAVGDRGGKTLVLWRRQGERRGEKN